MAADWPRTVLVTGATGFVARAVTKDLAARGHRVRLAVRNGSSAELTPSCVAVGDIDAFTDWRAAVDGVDAVVHLAARVHVMREEGDSRSLAAFRTVNSDGTKRLALQAARAGVRRFVFISSIKVNGEQTTLGCPFRADDAPCPAGPYAQSKYEAELALREVSTGSGMGVAVIRPPLIYGPGVRANFRSLMKWIHRRVPLPLASVRNRRSLLFVGNLADLISTCIEFPRELETVLLASDGEDLSTPELLRGVGRALGTPAWLVPFPVPLLAHASRLAGRGAIFDRLCGSLQVDTIATRRTLGWTPPYSVADALSETARDYLRSVGQA